MIKLVANKSKILADHVEQIVKLVTATQNVTIECSNSINELISPDNLTNKTESANKEISLNDFILFNKQQMQSSDRITLDRKENTITITNISSKDAGIYECATITFIKEWNKKSNKWIEENFINIKTTRSVALYVFSMISLF